MILGGRNRFSSNDVGARFLAGKNVYQRIGSKKAWLRDYWMVATHLFTIESVDGRSMAARDQDGRLELFELNYDGAISGKLSYSLMWTNDMPNGTFEEIAHFAESILSAGSSSHAFAFHIVSINPGSVTANLVTFADRDGSNDLKAELDTTPGDEVGAAFFSPEIEIDIGDHTWTAGAFVVATGLTVVKHKDGRLTTKVKEIRTIREAMTREEIGAWLPAGPDYDPNTNYIGIYRRPWVPLGDSQDYDREVDRGIARSEPNRALVYWYPDTDHSGQESTSCYVMGTEGITFYEADSIADNFYGEDIEHGLWIFENAKWWVHQSWDDYDCGLEGDWRRATIEDLDHFGLTLECADKELCDIREIDLEPGIAAATLALTSETAAPAD